MELYQLEYFRVEYVDALKALPKDADKTKTLASEGLAFIDKLFGLEREYEGMTPAARFEARLEQRRRERDSSVCARTVTTQPPRHFCPARNLRSVIGLLT